MSIFSVRTIVDWSNTHYNKEDSRSKYLYEERITIWKATTAEEAIEYAEMSDKNYCEGSEMRIVEFAQSYVVDEEEIADLKQGAEVYSLLRGSDLEVEDYIDAFFDTGLEKQGQIT